MVTGGAGFIGSHTVDALLNGGSEVWVIDDISTGSLRNLRPWIKNRRFHFHKTSVRNYRRIESFAKRVEAIIHLAAVVSPFISVKKPEVANEINVAGTLNILRAALKAEVKKVVYASSSSVYGNQKTLPISESNPLQPVTPYGVSKLSGEKYCIAFYQTFGLQTIALRYFNVYGIRQSASPYSGVIAIFVKRLQRGLAPEIFGDGEQRRDFIHVSDVVEANVRAMNTDTGNGEAFNIGTGQPTSINNLVHLLADLCGQTRLNPINRAPRMGDIMQSYADVRKAKHVLGFQSKIALRDGLGLLARSMSDSVQKS